MYRLQIIIIVENLLAINILSKKLLHNYLEALGQDSKTNAEFYQINIWLHFIVQFAMLETTSVDDDLADMKRELSGSTKVTQLEVDSPLNL